jgi:hypothetical protein
LQADHKIPLIRGGKNEPGNWQPLCVDCNVSKRRACEGCTLDCKQCPWAFPDSLKNSLVVPLPTGLYERLERMSASRQKSKVSLVAEAVEEYLTNRTK